MKTTTAARSVDKVLTEIKAPTTKEHPKITASSEAFPWEFETLKDPKLEDLLRAVKEYASAFQTGTAPYWFCILGKSGIGKTHLARKVAAFWNDKAGERWISESLSKPMQAYPACLVDWRRFISGQRQGDFKSIEPIIGARFAILDDIGTEYDPSGFAKSRLDEILNARLGKWTVITSNVGLEKLAEVDSRIASRILRDNSKVLEIEGVPDWNLRT